MVWYEVRQKKNLRHYILGQAHKDKIRLKYINVTSPLIETEEATELYTHSYKKLYC